MTSDKVLQVQNLKTSFKTDEGIVKAVNGISFDLHKGEILGIVGESACGKSVTSLSIMRLIPSPPGKIEDGSILFNGEDLLSISNDEIRDIRGNKISMIFQDPMTSLNPFLKISTQLIETLMLHQGLSKKEAYSKSIEMLRLVGIPSPENRIDDYPHQFSGGMRQRVMIAMGLSCEPEILIADEPTTALDVTIQAQILELISELSKELNTATIMITHDLGVVAGLCDNICVMYAGRIIEKGDSDQIFNHPKHPYTKGLLKSVPRLDISSKNRLFSINGQPPNLIDLPSCCAFYPRCSQASDTCKSHVPQSVALSGNHEVSCFLYEGGAS